MNQYTINRLPACCPSQVACFIHGSLYMFKPWDLEVGFGVLLSSAWGLGGPRSVGGRRGAGAGAGAGVVMLGGGVGGVWRGGGGGGVAV